MAGNADSQGIRGSPGPRRRSAATVAALACVALAGCWCPRAGAAEGAGSLLAWGSNAHGVLGNETVSESRAPVPVPAGAIPPGTSVSRVDAGDYLSQALGSDGRVYSWGANLFGELGDGTTTGSFEPVAVSQGALPPGQSFVQASSGGEFCLALSSGGWPYGWGANGGGELGDGTTADSSVPVAVSAGAIPSGTTFSRVAAGGSFGLALSPDGRLYSWGAGSDGELGDGSTSGSSLPVAVSAGAVPPGTTFTQVAAGAFFGLALSSTGQVYAWGDGETGQLGDGSTSSSSVPVAVSAGVIPPGTDITRIAAGYSFALALSSTGQVYAWGQGVVGQLGDGTASNSLTPVAVLQGPGGASDETITQISAGSTFGLALSSGGRVLAWGENASGELGDGSSAIETLVPVPVALPAETTVDAVASGSQAEFALAVVGDLAIPAGALPAGAVGVPYGGSAEGTGGAPPYSWSATGLPPGLALGPEGAITGTPSAAGVYFVPLTVTDVDGLTVHREVPFVISAASPAARGAQPGPSAGPPTLTRLKETHRRWREPGSHPGAVPIGTSFSFDVDERASVTFAFAQVGLAQKGGHRSVRRGTLSFAARPGKVTRHFRGRLPRRTLKPGRYRVSVVAIAADGRRSTPHSLGFTIVG